jgi:hypothetical protein
MPDERGSAIGRYDDTTDLVDPLTLRPTYGRRPEFEGRTDRGSRLRGWNGSQPPAGGPPVQPIMRPLPPYPGPPGAVEYPPAGPSSGSPDGTFTGPSDATFGGQYGGPQAGPVNGRSVRGQTRSGQVPPPDRRPLALPPGSGGDGNGSNGTVYGAGALGAAPAGGVGSDAPANGYGSTSTYGEYRPANGYGTNGYGTNGAETYPTSAPANGYGTNGYATNGYGQPAPEPPYPAPPAAEPRGPRPPEPRRGQPQAWAGPPDQWGGPVEQYPTEYIAGTPTNGYGPQASAPPTADRRSAPPASERYPADQGWIGMPADPVNGPYPTPVSGPVDPRLASGAGYPGYPAGPSSAQASIAQPSTGQPPAGLLPSAQPPGAQQSAVPASGSPGEPFNGRYPGAADGGPLANAYGPGPRQIGHPRPARIGEITGSSAAVRVQPVDDFGDDPEDELAPEGGYKSAVLATLIWYAIPAALYIAYAFYLGGSARPGCVSADGGPCPSPRAEALHVISSNIGLITVAIVLSTVIAVMLRWATTGWRALAIGFAAAVVGGGATTVLITTFSGG